MSGDQRCREAEGLVVLDGKEVRQNERRGGRVVPELGGYGQAPGHWSRGGTHPNPRWLGFQSWLCRFLT